MAEEIKEETKEASSSLGLSKEDIAELIKTNVGSSMKELMANLPQQQPVYQEPAQDTRTDDDKLWDNIIGSRVNPSIANAQLRADAAEDKADFYASDTWLTDIDDLLPGETEAEIKEAKKEIRKRLETTFSNLIKTNRATPRADLIEYEVGRYLRENKTKFLETVEKKSKKKGEVELEKAKKAVSISSGNISNFSPKDIHGMDYDKVVKEFGEVLF